MLSRRSTVISSSSGQSKRAKCATPRIDLDQDSTASTMIDFSHEIESGMSVVIPREKYERIRRAVEVECPPTDFASRDPNKGLQDLVLHKMSQECEQHERVGRCQSKWSTRAKSCPSGGRRWTADNDDDDEKAKELRMKLERFREEQEVEIRSLNEMITEAKCLAMRETQIVDKQRRRREARMTELEIDKRLEERERDLDRRIEEFRSKRNMINQSYADMLRQQIDANEALRKNAERTMREWEAKLNERRMDCYRRDVAKEQNKKLDQQRELREGLEECVVQRKKLAEQRNVEEAAIRKKIEQYASERVAWRSSLEEAETRKVAVRQLQTAAVLDRINVGGGGHDASERMRAMKTRCIREELDRDWRLREVKMEAARRDARRILTEAREEQIACKRQEAAEEAARERQQHHLLVELEKKQTEAYRDAEMRRRQRALEYGEYVRSQIIEKEEKSRREKEDHILEAALVKKCDDDHDEKLLEMKAKKLQQLKCQEIPDRYVMEIARKSRVPWTILQ